MTKKLQLVIKLENNFTFQLKKLLSMQSRSFSKTNYYIATFFRSIQFQN